MDIFDVLPKWILPSDDLPEEPWMRGVFQKADTRLAKHVARHILTIGKWTLDHDLALQPMRFGQEGLTLHVVKVLNLILEGVAEWHRDRFRIQQMEDYLASDPHLEPMLLQLKAQQRNLERGMTRCVCAIPCPSRHPGKPPVVSGVREVDDLFTGLDEDLEPIPLCMAFSVGREGYRTLKLPLPVMRDRLVSTFAKALKH